jgi:hypothetical protein
VIIYKSKLAISGLLTSLSSLTNFFQTVDRTMSSNPELAQLATRSSTTGTFWYTQTIADNAGNVFQAVNVNTAGTTSIFNYSAAPTGGGEVQTTLYGTCTFGNYIVKYNKFGAVQWVLPIRQFGQSNDLVQMTVDGSGNLYVGQTSFKANPYQFYNAVTASGGTIPSATTYGTLPHGGDYTGYLAKYRASDGAVLWATWFSDTSQSVVITALSVDSAGNVYVQATGRGLTFTIRSFSSAPVTAGGSINTTTFGTYTRLGSVQDSLIMKFNTSGVAQWATSITNYSTSGGMVGSMGVNSADELFVLLCTQSGGDPAQTVTLRSFTNLSGVGGTINTAAWGTTTISAYYLIKYTSSGTPVWLARGTNSGYHYAVNHPTITFDSSDNLYLCLQTNWSGSGTFFTYTSGGGSGGAITTTQYGTSTLVNNSSLFIIKYNSTGTNILWLTNNSSAAASTNNRSFRSQCDSSGNFFLVTHYSNTLRLLNYTSAPVSGGAVGLTLYGTLPNLGSGDIALIKYNPNGQVIMATRIGSAGDETASSSAIDGIGNIWVTGIYGSVAPVISNFAAAPVAQGNVTLSTWGTLPVITAASAKHMFLVKYSAATGPDPPNSLSATPQNGALSISFSAPSSNGGSAITDYEYSLNNSTWTSLGTSTPTTFTVSGLVNGTPQTVYIRAISAVANGTSASVTGTPSTIPGIPTSLLATPQNNALSISFSAPSSNGGSAVTDYEYSLNNSAPWTSLSTATPTTFTVSGLTNGTPQIVYLRAINARGEGSSTSVTGTPATTPDAPTSLSAAAQDGTLSISFSAPSNNGGSAITNYQYSLNNSTWTSLNTATPATFTVSGLTNGISQTVYIRAVNARGTGSSASVSGTPTSFSQLSSLGIFNGNASQFSSAVSSALSPTGTIDISSIGVTIDKTLPVETVKTVVKTVINSIFESATQIDSFIASSSELPVLASNAKDNILFVKSSPNPTPFVLDSKLNGTTSVYVGLSKNGEKNTFSLGGSTFSIQKTSIGYDFTDSSNTTTTYLDGNFIKYNNLNIIFGGASISQESPHTPIEINFNVEIDGNSAVSIFGDQFVPPTNIIIPVQKLPVNALYDEVTKKGLIEFMEPSADPDNIYVKLANTDSSANGGQNLSNSYKVTLKTLAKGLQRILCDKFDCQTAVPFNASKYSGEVVYTTQRDFGRIALGAFSHYLFGHVDATSAITNDLTFIKSMLSLSGLNSDAAAKNEDPNTGPSARYNAYDSNIINQIENSELSSWSNPIGSASDANLARRLVAAIVGKGLDGSGALKESKVVDLTKTEAEKKAELAYIVRQVVGQDAQRLMDEDNSERTKDVRRLLRFYENDIIYMNIKLKTPNVTVATGQIGVTKTGLQDKYITNEQSYTLKITLGPAETL